MDELKQAFPPDVDYLIPFDTTRSSSASIKEVVMTMLEAAVLVLIVVFVFLQTWRATLIPMLAVPVSLIGTFAGLWLLGFSINTLTLFAMVLAIGIVVDDAIVVLENVERLMREEGMSPLDASVEAMREVSGAVIGDRAGAVRGVHPGGLPRRHRGPALPAVRGHGHDLGGDLGLRRAHAHAGAVRAAAQAPRARRAHFGERFFRPFNRGFTWLTGHFLGGVNLVLRHRVLALAGFVVLLAFMGWLVWKVPGSFVPEEDQGYIIAAVVLPDGATLERTGRTTDRLRLMNQENKAIDDIFVINGFDLIGGGSTSNAATIFIPLEPWDDRNQTAQQLAQQVSGMGFALPDGIAFAFNPPPIQGLGQAGGFEVYVQARGETDPQRLAQVTQDFIAALGKQPGARRLQHLLPADRAAIAGRGRSREGAGARRAGRRGLRRAAGADGLALRQRLQPLGPHLSRARCRPTRPTAPSPTISAACTCARAPPAR